MGRPRTSTVVYEFLDEELRSMCFDEVPHEVQIRMRLNKAGFRFKDDGKPSAIFNREPEPLGNFIAEQTFDGVRYKQIIRGEENDKA